MDAVLEHVINPLKTLQDIGKILKPGGKFIAAVPNPRAFGRYFFGHRWLQWHLPYHRHFFTRKSISVLAEQSSFTIEVMRSSTKSQNLLDNWISLFNGSGKNKKATAVHQVFGNFNAQHKKRWDVWFYLSLKKSRLFSLPMRIADLCDVGDWNIIILQKTSAHS